jgi:aspartate-semialdehyde dehydrogenase
VSAEAPAIAVVGATGAVGREALTILAARGHPPERVRAFASPRSAGERLRYGERELVARQLAAAPLASVDGALFAADAETARAFAPAAVSAGVTVVDNSSAFRADPDVPLVVPEVNGSALRRDPPPRLVANPNCSTILLLVALEPLRRAFGVELVVVSTYQAVSGAGLAAMAELEEQVRAHVEGRAVAPRVFPEPCAFNVFPHESPVDPRTGLNGEEVKLLRETRRIWDDAGARIVPTCARVPVMRSHSQSVTVTLCRPATEAEVRSALAAAPSVRVLDDRSAGVFPTPLRASGGDKVLVGRVRPAPCADSAGDGEAYATWCLWLCGDQLRKGAAGNAISILDALLGTPPRRSPRRGDGRGARTATIGAMAGSATTDRCPLRDRAVG